MRNQKKVVWIGMLFGIVLSIIIIIAVAGKHEDKTLSENNGELVINEIVGENDSSEIISSIETIDPSEKNESKKTESESETGGMIQEDASEGDNVQADRKLSQKPVAAPEEGDSEQAEEGQKKPALTPEGNVIPEEMIPVVLAEHEKEEVIVVFHEGYDEKTLTSAIQTSGCTLPQTITEEDVMFGFAKLTVAPDYDVEHAMIQLEQLPEIKLAQPNFIYHQADAQTEAISINDPDRSQQWMLDSIHAYEAWNVVKSEGKVTVAILDNGFSLDHEDLDDNYLRDEENDIVMYYAQDNTTEYEVEGSHGTHVAGIVAAEANNGKGVAGVSYNAKIMPVNVFNPLGGASTYDIIKGLYFVLTYSQSHPEANIHVINMSLGGPLSAEAYREDYNNEPEELDRVMLGYIEKCTDNNILTVMATGNDAETYNGGYLNWASDLTENTLNVISLENGTDGEEPKKSYFSNYNREGEYAKNISAPGSDIYSTSYFYKTYSNGYEMMSGTSMATPCVSGVAALVFAANPNLTAREAREIILSTATKIHKDENLYKDGFSLEYGYGEVDAFAAVTLAKNLYELHLSGDTEMLKDKSLTLVPVNQDNEEVKGNYQWSSSDEEIAVVSETGEVTGLSAGTVTISAEIGEVKLTKNITVYDVSFEGADSTEFSKGQTFEFYAYPSTDYWRFDVIDEWGDNAGKTSYADSIGAGLSLDAYFYQIGTVFLTATLEKNKNVRYIYPVTVTPSDISILDVTVENAAYTGEAVIPVVKAQYERKKASDPESAFEILTFKEGEDFTLTFENNVEIGDKNSKNPPIVILTGKNVLTGTVRIPFSITGNQINEEDISLEEYEFEYTGEEHSPKVTVIHDGVKLKKNRDYKVEYIDNIDASENESNTPVVRVTGIGEYSGGADIGFTIHPADINDTVMAEIENIFYTGRPQKPKVSLTFHDSQVYENGNYQVSYENNTEVGEATVIIEGVGNFTGTKTGKFRICNKLLVWDDVRLSYPGGKKPVYDGTPKTLNSEIRYNGKYVEGEEYDLLIEGEDYTLCYDDNINAGDVNVRIVFNDEYAMLERPYEAIFTIEPADISEAAIEGLGSYAYTGEEIEPKPVITFGETLLTEGEDYTLSYENNVETGDASSENPPTVTVTGTGNFTGSVSILFTITEHTHTWSFSAEGATITASCENEDGLHEGDLEQTVTIIAPEYDTEDGEGNPEASIEGSIDGVELPEILYYEDDTLLDGAPTAAGNYAASITIEDATATVEYTIGEKEEENSEEESEENSEEEQEEVYEEDPEDWLDPLRDKLTLAAATADETNEPQTVIFRGNHALPYEFMELLSENPLVTLEYHLDYEGEEYTVLLSGENVFADSSVEWYGPVFLIDYYCKNMKAGSGMYIVQRGDTLSKIAKRFGSTVPMLASRNGIKNPDYILSGQVIVY